MTLKSCFKAAMMLPLMATIFACNSTSKEQLAEEAFAEIAERNQTVGLAVVAVKDGQIVYSNAFGVKDLENQTPLELNDLFRIASISKSFTATGILQLVEQGKLSLDQDISELVGFEVRNPNFPEKPITVGMLLSHSSSMSDANGYFSLNSINPDSSATWRSAWNEWEPGTKYQYCNMGYNTLGTIIERVSDIRFDRYIVDNILSPLDLYGGYEVLSLDSTKIVKIYEFNREDSTFKHRPEAYATRADEIANYVMGFSTPLFSPTGGMKISPLGLAKVMQMHMNYGSLDSVKIIDSENSKLMQSQIISTGDESGHYGFAIETTNKLLDGHTMIGHTGGAYGVFTSMFWNEDRSFGFVVMTNGCNVRRDNGFMSIHRESVRTLYDLFIAEK